MNGSRSAALLCLLLPIAVACAKKPQPERHCRDNGGCASSELCVFDPGLCGKGQAAGTCRPKPSSCAASTSPACACDGKVYDSTCAAQAAGVDLSAIGGCPKPVPNYAPCGAHYCDVRESYCEIYLSDVFDLPGEHFCRPLPAACKPDSGGVKQCDCFPVDTPCLGFCGPLPTGGVSGFHLTCQGKKPPAPNR